MVQQSDQIRISNVDGVKAWLIVMVSIFSLKFILENYLSYGIIVNPILIVTDLGNLLLGNWWLSGLICACCFQQILHMYLIEKSIILNIISERTGMILHALNSFFVGCSCSIISYTFDCNQFVVKLWMCYVLFTFTKSWSFACVNMVARTRKKTEQQTNNAVTEDVCSKTVVYPQNVNIVNIISYMVFTPPIEYQLETKRREKWNLYILPMIILKALTILYCIFFVAYQYVIPELENASLNISQRNYLNLVACILKVVFPVNVVWLLYFYVFAFKIYLPAYTEIVGMKGIIYQTDWWNAESIRDYWPKWNIPMFACFKNNIVKPLLKMGYSRNTAYIVVVICSGIMHEISLTHPCRVYNGLAFLGFVIQIPGNYMSTRIAKNFGKGYGNMFLWFSLCSTHAILAVFVFYSHK